MRLESARGPTLILLMALFFLTPACSLLAGKEVAERSVEQFHMRYDASNSMRSISTLMTSLATWIVRRIW